MPLTPKYTWEETPAELTLVVSLPGLHKPSLDVFRACLPPCCRSPRQPADRCCCTRAGQRPNPPPCSGNCDPQLRTDGVRRRAGRLGGLAVVVLGTVTDVYAKVNLPPYLLHVDLYQEVDSVRSAALIDVNVVSFRLVKVRRGLRTGRNLRVVLLRG
jgi:hypothetical protein